MNVMHERLIAFIMFLVLFLYLGTEAYKRHEHLSSDDWRSEIRADGAGYYVYLPMWFDYGYEAENFPENADKKCGEGFSLNDSSGIVRTKYFSGTAMLLAPFYLGWKAISNDDVFSESFHRMVSWAASFTMALAALFLFYAIRGKSGNFASLFAVVTAIFGTTAYYYTVQNPMWSHVWSFFTVSCLMLLLHKAWNNFTAIRVILLGLFSGLLIIIRPTNALLLLPLFFFEPEQRPAPTFRNTVLFITGAILPMLPQLWYWKILSGHWWFDAYSGEGFQHLDSPRIAQLLFDPMCGLFPWTPVFLVFTALLFSAIAGRYIYRYTLLIVYILLTYLFASWSTVNFGHCGFGARTYTEMVPLFIPLLATFMRRSYLGIQSKWWILTGLAVILSLSITIRLNKFFSHCYDHSYPYDYRSYKRFLLPEKTKHYCINETTQSKQNLKQTLPVNELVLTIQRHAYFRNLKVALNINGIPDGEKLRFSMSNDQDTNRYDVGEYGNGNHYFELLVAHYPKNPIVKFQLKGRTPGIDLSRCTISAEAD